MNSGSTLSSPVATLGSTYYFESCPFYLLIPPFSDRENMFFALVVGLGVHMVVTCGVTALPLIRASEGEPPLIAGPLWNLLLITTVPRRSPGCFCN